MNFKTEANAKINLYLQVLNRRRDKYHNIFSLNASLGLSDTITFNKVSISDDMTCENKIEIISAGGRYAGILENVKTEENLITKAIRAYMDAIGRRCEISVSVRKEIPSGAGLGGGSSNAAAALRLLNDQFSEFSRKELLKIASLVGSDVPYCLEGGYAICRGRGEEIEPIKGSLDYPVLVIDSGIHIDTAWAYSSLNRDRENGGCSQKTIEKSRGSLKKGIKKGDIQFLAPLLKNDFEGPVFSKYPELVALKKDILDQGAVFAGMTGSGSGLIGIFSDSSAAEAAEISLKKKARVYRTEFTV